MDAATWQIISIIGFSLFGLLLIIAVFMFVRMNIPAIIGDLSGKTAKKQIQEIRERNQKTGNKSYRPSAFNLERGEVTTPVSKSKKLGKTRGATQAKIEKGQTASTSKPKFQTNTFGREKLVGSGTIHLESITSGKMPLTGEPKSDTFSEVQNSSEGTAVLSDGPQVLHDETQVLSNGTEVLYDGTEVLADGTEVLNDDGTQVLTDGTQVLADETQVLVPNMVAATTKLDQDTEEQFLFEIVKDVMMVHTDEVI